LSYFPRIVECVSLSLSLLSRFKFKDKLRSEVRARSRDKLRQRDKLRW
jgi:hypothetical protein